MGKSLRHFVSTLCALLTLTLTGTVPAIGAEQTDPPVTVVLALSGGGIKGYAHVGVLKVLEQNNIHVAGIVGTSMGSIIGGLYASGYSADLLAHLIETSNLTQLLVNTKDKAYGRSGMLASGQGVIRPEIHYDKNWKVVGPMGIFSGGQLVEFLARKTDHVATTDFNKLPIPFAAVATDLSTGEKVVLCHGSLSSAMRASSSLPGVFDPWRLEGRWLVDGGLVSNMPVETARELFPGYPVVAVDLTSRLEPDSSLGSVFDVISQTITILTHQNVEAEAKLADVLIHPDVKEYPVLGKTDVREIFARGEEAARAAIPELLRLPRRTPPEREIQQYAQNPIVTEVRLTGLEPQVAKVFQDSYTRRWKGKPLNKEAVVETVDTLLKRRDIRSVDYNFSVDEEGGHAVVDLAVNRYPAHRVALSGNASTLAGRGWLTVTSENSDVFLAGDQLELRAYLADNFGLYADYSVADPSESPWEYRLWASRYTIKPRIIPDAENLGDFQRWWRYGGAVLRRFDIDDENVRFEAGVKVDSFKREGLQLGHASRDNGVHDAYFVPFLDFRWNWQNRKDDPTFGLSFDLGLDAPLSIDALLVRAALHGTVQLTKSSKLELTGGYVHGAMNESPLYAAYLGAGDELLSLSSHPIAAQSFLWGRAALVHSMHETFFGDLDLELFGTWADARDTGGKLIARPWELGVALSAPRQILNARLYALYSSEDQWKFGISFGLFNSEPFMPF